jgi:hypothetical protein
MHCYDAAGLGLIPCCQVSKTESSYLNQIHCLDQQVHTICETKMNDNCIKKLRGWLGHCAIDTLWDKGAGCAPISNWGNEDQYGHSLVSESIRLSPDQW